MTPPAKKKRTMPTPMSPPAKKWKTTATTNKKRTMPTPMSPPAKKRKTSATTKKKPTMPTAKKTKITPTTEKKPKLMPQSTTPTPTPQSTTPESTLIPSLPYDLLLNCIARVSRLYYPTLSLVSKSFRSLIASPELYKVRSLLGRTESCLYVYISSMQPPRWYTLCRKPDEIILNDDIRRKKNEQNKSSGYALATVPDHHPRRAVFQGLVVVGSDIYSIAPSPESLAQELEPSPVSILDCRSHTWRPAPSLRVTLTPLFSASVVDQNIYLAGTFKDGDSRSKKLVEVFDTETQTWDPVPIPCSLANGRMSQPTTCIDGKFHVMHSFPTDEAVVAYDSKEGRWDPVAPQILADLLLMNSDSYCEIENVLYAVNRGEIRWYDTEVSKWRKLEGLVGLAKFPYDKTGIRLADYGGKMAVLWHERCGFSFFNKRIWCAEISLEKRKNCEIWGKVEWVDHVLTLSSFEIVKVLAATV